MFSNVRKGESPRLMMLEGDVNLAPVDGAAGARNENTTSTNAIILCTQCGGAIGAESVE